MNKPKKATRKKVISHRVNLTLPLHVYDFFAQMSEESGARIGTVISRFLDRTVATGLELAQAKTPRDFQKNLIGSLTDPLSGRVKAGLQVSKMAKKQKKARKGR